MSASTPGILGRSPFAAGAIVVVLAASLGGAVAHAAAPQRVGVAKFHGPAEGATRAAVMRAVKANHFQIIGGEQIERTAKKLKVKLDSNPSFESVARALGISAFVTGEVTRRKATLTVRSGDGGAFADEASWAGPDPRKLAAAVGRTFWKRLGPALEKAKPPGGAKLDVTAEEETVSEDAEEAPSGAEPKADGATGVPPRTSGTPPPAPRPASTTARPASAPPSDDREPPAETVAAGDDEETAKRPHRPNGSAATVEQLDEALSLAFGPRYGMRSLSYTDDRYQMNSSYALIRSPLVGLDVDFFPGALSSRGAVASFGLTGSFAYLLPVVKSQFPGGGESYTTKSLSWSMGLKVRLPGSLFLTGGVGAHYYEVADNPAAKSSDVPTTNYQFIRGGAGFRRRLSSVVLVMAHGAYLHCLKLGQIGDAGYYPKATGAGFEAGAALGFLLSPRVELRVGVDVQRFGLAFHVTVPDYMNGAKTAGGAVDQYSDAWLALAFVLGPEAKPAPPTTPAIKTLAPILDE